MNKSCWSCGNASLIAGNGSNSLLTALTNRDEPCWRLTFFDLISWRCVNGSMRSLLGGDNNDDEPENDDDEDEDDVELFDKEPGECGDEGIISSLLIKLEWWFGESFSRMAILLLLLTTLDEKCSDVIVSERRSELSVSSLYFLLLLFELLPNLWLLLLLLELPLLLRVKLLVTNFFIECNFLLCLF